ncbi:MAG TPA: N-acetylmuramoyl-L-alanine amidase [Longimicrobiaceae bacterium]|jgi:N-acetyl-anhydromuramyl-L-alanine amidase AmpD
MRASNIPAYEAGFRTTPRDDAGKSFRLSPFTVEIPGTPDAFQAVSCTPADGDDSFYYREEFPKKRIVLHYTAGYLRGDIAALTRRDNHVSVPFVVARDGTVYNLWSSRYWSYHLGKGAAGGNTEMSRSSIGIELSNLGYLVPRGDTLVTYGGSPYCALAEEDQYVKLAEPFRGYSYYATHTDAQYRSLVCLLRYLTRTYDIPAEFLPEAQRYEVYAAVDKFRGITTHVNYQPESYGKWDIGPAFDWARVIAALTTVPVPAIEPRAELPTVEPKMDVRGLAPMP